MLLAIHLTSSMTAFITSIASVNMQLYQLRVGYLVYVDILRGPVQGLASHEIYIYSS